jgi:hypothetical protein
VLDCNASAVENQNDTGCSPTDISSVSDEPAAAPHCSGAAGSLIQAQDDQLEIPSFLLRVTMLDGAKAQ